MNPCSCFFYLTCFHQHLKVPMDKISVLTKIFCQFSNSPVFLGFHSIKNWLQRSYLSHNSNKLNLLHTVNYTQCAVNSILMDLNFANKKTTATIMTTVEAKFLMTFFIYPLSSKKHLPQTLSYHTSPSIAT